MKFFFLLPLTGLDTMSLQNRSYFSCKRLALRPFKDEEGYLLLSQAGLNTNVGLVIDFRSRVWIMKINIKTKDHRHPDSVRPLSIRRGALHHGHDRYSQSPDFRDSSWVKVLQLGKLLLKDALLAFAAHEWERCHQNQGAQ
ncbi:MAG TPA: hypothetical protein VG488_13915 [Candidatus Angelobacter sp.]|jgi:hypothetical protein|nr:hypothetical protein [Candidatus Angelobacter sp.]